MPHQRERVLDGPDDVFDVDVEERVHVRFGQAAQWREAADAGVGKHDIDVANLLTDLVVESTQIGRL